MGAAEADPTSVGDIRYPLQQAVVYVMSFASDGSTASTIVGQLRENSGVWVLAEPNLVVRAFPDSLHNFSRGRMGHGGSGCFKIGHDSRLVETVITASPHTQC